MWLVEPRLLRARSTEEKGGFSEAQARNERSRMPTPLQSNGVLCSRTMQTSRPQTLRGSPIKISSHHELQSKLTRHVCALESPNLNCNPTKLLTSTWRCRSRWHDLLPAEVEEPRARLVKKASSLKLLQTVQAAGLLHSQEAPA